MSSHPIATIWKRIEQHAGESFNMIRGGAFTYKVLQGHVYPDRTNHRIAKSDFEKALKLVPLRSTGPLQQLRGPSFVYAILMDGRIRQGDW